VEGTCAVSRSDRSFEQALTAACNILERICAEQGISLDDLPPPPPLEIDAVLLKDAANEYGVAVHALGLETAGVLVAGKVAHIVSYLDGDDDHGAWDADGAPNLLLIEKLLAGVELETERRKVRAPRGVVERVEKRGRRLRGLLAPLLERIPPPALRILTAMAAAGCAPSPFVRVKHRPGAGGLSS
jgi:hypothetical protein